MFMGAYWGSRRETREEVALRLAGFLYLLSASDSRLSVWYLKGDSRKTAKQKITADLRGVAVALTGNRRDADNETIPELGLSFAAWNGQDVSLSCTMGACHPLFQNRVVVSQNALPGSGFSEQRREILSAAVATFRPEHAVVTGHEVMIGADADDPWGAGWLIFQNGELREDSSFCQEVV